jgi:hypothetical protein
VDRGEAVVASTVDAEMIEKGEDARTVTRRELTSPTTTAVASKRAFRFG